MKITPHQKGAVVFMLRANVITPEGIDLLEVRVQRRRDRVNKHGTKLFPIYDVERLDRSQSFGLVPHDKLLTKEAAVAWKLRYGDKVRECFHV